MVRRITQKSCCGNTNVTLIFDKPFKKSDLPKFHERGYSSPAHFTNAGIFYVQKIKISARCSFGMKKVSVLSGNSELVEQFVKDAKEILGG